MNISEMKIRNIKGFSNACFNMQILPDKPNLLVAPNGFGKSSIAAAFASMNTVRMTLLDQDYYKEDTSLPPELSITIGGQKLTADQNKNEIRQQFDVLVIKSGLTPKAKKRFRGSVSSSLEVKPITICKIPEKALFLYKVGDHRVAFGLNGKLLPNISDLLNSSHLIDAIEGFDLSKFGQVRIQSKLKSLIGTINQRNGSAEQIVNWIENNIKDELREISPLYEIGQCLIRRNLAKSEVEAFLAAYQIASLYSEDQKQFKAALDWLRYTSKKADYEELLSHFKSSQWQWAKLEELKKKKMLVINFPKAHQISNGQRDIITLVVQLHKTLYEGSRKPLILVIDEVFDYLDDANLVSFQYYVTSIIEAYKERNQKIYPLILTHLDPGVFFDFCFNKHKIQINYLQAKPSGKAKNSLKLVEARDKQDKIKDDLEKYWFHFHTDSYEIPEDEWPSHLPDEWRSSEVFHDYTRNELFRYLEDKNYDPLAVCFAVRASIERLGYELIAQSDQKEKFLNDVRTTRKKMDFVANSGAEVPESYFLLGLIYNTNLHWTPGRDYVSPLIAKLNHPTIRQLISGVIN